MSNSILDNISNASGGHPYNGSGVPMSGAGQGSSAGISNINGNPISLGGSMTLTHSLNGIEPMNLNESGR